MAVTPPDVPVTPATAIAAFATHTGHTIGAPPYLLFFSARSFARAAICFQPCVNPLE